MMPRNTRIEGAQCERILTTVYGLLADPDSVGMGLTCTFSVTSFAAGLAVLGPY